MSLLEDVHESLITPSYNVNLSSYKVDKKVTTATRSNDIPLRKEMKNLSSEFFRLLLLDCEIDCRLLSF